MRTRPKYIKRLAAWIGALSLVMSFAPPTAAADDHDNITLSFGAFDSIRHHDDSGFVGLDYRVPGVAVRGLKPWVGLLSTSDKAVWGGAGLYFDWAASPNLRLTPSFGAGFYEDGVGLDLGHTLQFRSQVEVSYRFASDARIGINMGHLSNGGLSESNQGTEYVNVSYSLPLTRRYHRPPGHAAPRVAADGPEN